MGSSRVNQRSIHIAIFYGYQTWTEEPSPKLSIVGIKRSWGGHSWSINGQYAKKCGNWPPFWTSPSFCRVAGYVKWHGSSPTTSFNLLWRSHTLVIIDQNVNDPKWPLDLLLTLHLLGPHTRTLKSYNLWKYIHTSTWDMNTYALCQEFVLVLLTGKTAYALAWGLPRLSKPTLWFPVQWYSGCK